MSSYLNEKWRRGTLTLWSYDRSWSKEVPALVRGRLAFRTDYKGARGPIYPIVHIPTGSLVGANFRTQRDAKAGCDRIAAEFPDLVNLDADPSGGWSAEQCTKARKFMREISNA